MNAIALKHQPIHTQISMQLPLSDQTKFRLNEINKMKDYFHFEIQERNAMNKSKYLRKCVTTFDYFDKTLIVLTATRGISIIYFTTAVGAPI